MKLVMIIILLLSLSSCRNNDLASKSIYIGVLGIEYDNGINITALIPSTKNNDEKNNNTFIIKKSSGESINGALNYLELEESHVINYMHISSIIFNDSALNEKYLNEIIDLAIKDTKISFNSYIFTTNNKISDLYDVVNKEDLLLNQLMEPVYSYHIYQNVEPLHLVTMGKMVSNRKKFIVPIIKIKDSSILIDEGIQLDFFIS